MSERIDLSVGIHGKEVFLALRGRLREAQLPLLKENLWSASEGKDTLYFLDLEQARFESKAYLDLFVDFLNRVHERGARLVLLFESDENKAFFQRYLHIFAIFPSRHAFMRSGFLNRLRQTGVVYHRTTGLRLSPGTAGIAVAALAVLLLAFFSVIQSQDEEIRNREEKLQALENQYRASVTEIERLKGTIAPLKKMGLPIDTTQEQPLGALTDWAQFLEALEAERKLGQ
jgi:anti-anti-sigma regulatory factor